MKTVIVSGAQGQLGSSVVREFLDSGYRVIGLVRTLKADNSNINYEEMIVDLTDEIQCQQIVKSIIEKYKSIDVVILTAGGFAMGDLNNTHIKELNHQYKLNFETAYNIAHPAVIKMLEQDKGRIFLIGSKAGLDVSKAKSTIAYALSKSLLFRLAELFNGIAKNKNVVTSVVVPSVIDTLQNRLEMPDADFTSWVAPQHIAKIIAYYCSDEADALREPIIKIYNRS
jgi:NADP-dependent 3-hydroxy acid dehydrogenase YdfG